MQSLDRGRGGEGTTRRGWSVVEGRTRWVGTEHASAVGRSGDPNEKLFIFDIQSAIAGLFPPSSSRREAKEGKRGIEVSRFRHSSRYILTLCLWPHFPQFAGHLRKNTAFAAAVTLSPDRVPRPPQEKGFLLGSADPLSLFKSCPPRRPECRLQSRQIQT